MHITVRGQLWSTCIIWLSLSIYMTTLYITIYLSYSRRKLITLEVFKQYLKSILNTRIEDMWVSLTYFHFTIFYHLLYQLVDLFHDFLIRNRYSQQYIDFIIPKRTSDDKVDLNSQKEGRQLIYWIKHCPEYSTSIEKFIQLLNKKWEEEVWYDYTKRCYQDQLYCMPSELQDTAFSTLPQEVPVDYYDPEFFS